MNDLISIAHRGQVSMISENISMSSNEAFYDDLTFNLRSAIAGRSSTRTQERYFIAMMTLIVIIMI